MVFDKFGDNMDIYLGGIDFVFFYYDNELVQSEVFFYQCGKGEYIWVNYFLYMGYFLIVGSKMSKSLKNF